MCGRYGRRGDKQNIAEAFHVKGGLDEVDFGEECDCAPIQPVVWIANVCVVCSGKAQCKAHLDRGPGLGTTQGAVFTLLILRLC